MNRVPSRILALVLALATLAAIVPLRGVTPRDTNTLRMVTWGMPFEDLLFRDGYAADFEKNHPGVHIAYERYVEVADKYLAWHINGEGADVMRIRVTDYHALVAAGALAPLDEFIDSSDPSIGLSAAEQADYIPGVWDQLKVGGHRYALPSDNAQYGLYYNRAIFDSHHMAYPDESWTWDDLRDAAKRLTIIDARGRTTQYGIDFALWSWPFMTFFAQAGGELWDADRTTTLIDCDAGVHALELINELLPGASSARSPDIADTGTGPDKLFATGQAAMLLDGSWRAPDLELGHPDLDFAIAPLPRGDRRAVVSGSVLWGVSAHSRNRKLAWEMIRWMTNAEQSLRYWDALRVAPPARVSVIRSEAFRSTRGLVDAEGVRLTPAMSVEQFEKRAKWLLHAVTPDEADGSGGVGGPGFTPVAPYQTDLENKIIAMLIRATAPNRKASYRELLREAAAETHRIIDRDRAARGLPAVNR